MIKQITSQHQNNYKGSSAPSFGTKIPKELGTKTSDLLTRIGKRFNTPEQRIFIGATALAFQPWIELKNKKVDKKTSQSGASRAIGRAIIGTAVGVIVRGSCIRAGRFLAGVKIEKVKDSAGKVIEEIIHKNPKRLCYIQELTGANTDQILKYSKAVGNVMSFAVLPFTNLFVDAPLISKMSGWINTNVFKHKQEEEVKK